MFREITEKTEWEKKYSQTHEVSGKFLQSWEWGKFQSSLGRKVFRFSDGESIAQIIELPLPLAKKYWFCPKGPIMARGSSHIANGFIDELKTEAKKSGVVFLRIEPSEEANPRIRGLASNLFGAKQSRDINPRATSIINLSKTEDELLAAMHQKTRYNIKVAEKHSVAVRSSFIAHRLFDSVWKLFETTAKRDDFRLHPRSYYKKQILMPGVEVFTAEFDGKLLAAAIVIFSGSTATYLHGASSNEMRNVMAPYALHWTIIRRAKEKGCKHYDLWGVSDDAKSGWAGITRFKRGWGGEDVASFGTFDLPVNGFWYSVYRLARRLRP